MIMEGSHIRRVIGAMVTINAGWYSGCAAGEKTEAGTQCSSPPGGGAGRPGLAGHAVVVPVEVLRIAGFSPMDGGLAGGARGGAVAERDGTVAVPGSIPRGGLRAGHRVLAADFKGKRPPSPVRHRVQGVYSEKAERKDTCGYRQTEATGGQGDRIWNMRSLNQVERIAHGATNTHLKLSLLIDYQS